MWELPACECSSDGEQECVYVCSGLSEDDFIVSTLEGRENKSDAYSSGHCAAADRIKAASCELESRQANRADAPGDSTATI